MTGPAISAERFGPRQAQPLEDFGGDARDVLEGLFGKPDVKDLPMDAQIAKEQHDRLRAIAARKFGDVEGRELLEGLCDATVRRPLIVVLPGVKIEDAALYAAKREGQNETIYMLLAWIAEGRSGRTPRKKGKSS